MNVKNIKVIGRDRIGVISENYNIINKLNVDNFEIKGRKYSAPIAKNFMYVSASNMSNGSVVAETFGAGFVGDMEFGYVRTSKTNATVKTTGKEAAGFTADSERTIVSCHSTSKVYGKHSIAGFVSSNMGYVGYSSFTGKVYASQGKDKKAKFVGNFASYKAKAKKYRGFKLKPKYVKCKAKGSRYVKGKKVKNVFFGKYGKSKGN